MPPALRWTSADLAVLPDNNKRYEIIDGELYMSRQPHWQHQRTCGKICAALEAWSMQTGAGEANLAPGVITLISPLLAGFACGVASIF